MAENLNRDENAEHKTESEILVNNYGTKDSTVVIEEETRTVMLTDNETVIIEKAPKIDIVPKNRPRKVYAGMWGRAETATVALGMLAILSVVLLFVLVVLPAQKELERNRAERARLDTELASANNKYGDITSTEARVAQLTSSVSDFENRFLLSPVNGKAALYQRINGLISAYGLTNTTGPDYAPLETSAGGGQASDSERGREKYQSVFPGVYVTTTVEGSYQNLRRFIRDIETGNQFVIISAIELAPSENQDKNNGSDAAAAQTTVNNVRITPPAQNPTNYGTANPADFAEVNGGGGQPNPVPNRTVVQSPSIQTVTTNAAKSAPRGKTRGETVSLRLEMAAYFRRPNALQIPILAQ